MDTQENKENAQQQQESRSLKQCVKGIHWGKYILQEDQLEIQYNNKQIFQIPYQRIVNSNSIQKEEVNLELSRENSHPMDDTLCNIRFYVPMEKKDTQKKEEQKDQEEIQEEIKTPAQKFNQLIRSKAKLEQYSGKQIVTIPGIKLLVPRGKYTIDMYKKELRLVGPTFDYRISYNNFVRTFLLPKPDGNTMMFIIKFKNPIQQGQTTYNYMVQQFKKKDHEDIKISLPEEERIKLYNDKLKAEYNGPLYNTIASLFKYVIGVNVIVPSGIYTNVFGNPCIQCSKKAYQGLLFPLSKSLIFIHKPVIYIRINQLARVELQRIGTGVTNKLFDMDFVMRNGQRESFVGIDKREQDVIEEYFQKQGVQVKKIVEEKPNYQNDYYDDEGGEIEDEDTEHDGDYEAPDEEEEEDDDFDPTKVKMDESSSQDEPSNSGGQGKK